MNKMQKIFINRLKRDYKNNLKIYKAHENMDILARYIIIYYKEEGYVYSKAYYEGMLKHKDPLADLIASYIMNENYDKKEQEALACYVEEYEREIPTQKIYQSVKHNKD